MSIKTLGGWSFARDPTEKLTHVPYSWWDVGAASPKNTFSQPFGPCN